MLTLCQQRKCVVEFMAKLGFRTTKGQPQNSQYCINYSQFNHTHKHT